MALQGFESRFDDLTDYIIKITEEIWEGRGIGLIEDYYGADAPVKTPAGETRGIESVIRGTLETLKMFPDRTLLGEDVVWSEDEPGTYYSSHRIRSTMTHLGTGSFGQPTGRSVVARTIADCICRNNQIVDEWLVRDQAAIALQLGLDPREMGREIARALKAKGEWPSAEELVQRWSGGPQSGEPSGQAKWLVDTYKQLWSGTAINLVRERYDRAYLGYGPGDQALQGWNGLEQFLFDYLGAIPNGQFKLHHWIERNDPGMPTRISLRWSYSGTHSGHGRFGAPTGAPLVIMAISQAELRNGKIYAEWHMIDEINLWSQVALGEA
ncbi:ester cyclase [Zobellella maritima]|uniref:ester cyclase n=1 Tax=Zobellella maritima TaxID=2059725 RepID=UPI000E301369|nr:ester cyclase [Zobellella maritima]